MNTSSFKNKTPLTCQDINIRDPFVLCEDGTYYMYGTRARGFGCKTGGFDVYISTDLVNWSEPIECFNSNQYDMNLEVNWAPEVHKYNGNYYMFATFTRKTNGLRGTFILKADNPLGPFVPHSKGVVTPEEWECLDGTLYLNKEGKPYIVFCHEHTQIIDGTICYTPLSEDLTEVCGETVTLFHASECTWVSKFSDTEHYVTDGPFLYRTKTGELLMLWSSFINGQYAECLVKFQDGELSMNFKHLAPLVDNDGGHGMVFEDANGMLHLTYHTPNRSGFEHPYFVAIEDVGNNLKMK